MPSPFNLSPLFSSLLPQIALGLRSHTPALRIRHRSLLVHHIVAPTTVAYLGVVPAAASSGAEEVVGFLDVEEAAASWDADLAAIVLLVVALNPARC